MVTGQRETILTSFNFEANEKVQQYYLIPFIPLQQLIYHLEIFL